MLNWKIEKEIFQGKFSVDKDYSVISDELQEIVDGETGEYKIKKNISFALFFTLYLDDDYKIKKVTISFMNLFDSIYEFDAYNFCKLVTAIRKEIDYDGENDFDAIKKYFASYDELPFISLLDDNDIEREHN